LYGKAKFAYKADDENKRLYIVPRAKKVNPGEKMQYEDWQTEQREVAQRIARYKSET